MKDHLKCVITQGFNTVPVIYSIGQGLTSVPLLRDVTPASDSASIPEVLDDVLAASVDLGVVVERCSHEVEFVLTIVRRPGR